MCNNNIGFGRFNLPLYLLRKSRNWNQEQMATACGGYAKHTLNRIERGMSYGNTPFWIGVQNEFNIEPCDMWLLVTGSQNFNVDKYIGGNDEND